jgi:nucleoside phosphorylase
MPAIEGPVLIVTAFREEFAAVLSRARDPRSRGDHIRARIGPAPVALAMTGDGPGSAGRRASALCEALRPSALLGAGVAGGLVSRRVTDSSGDAPPPDPGLCARALAIAGISAGTFVTLDRPQVQSAGKIALGLAHDTSEPVAADMESAAWARAAAAHSVPYLVVRAISDTAEEDLPEYLARCVGSKGGINRSSVVLHALSRPSTIPALLRMRSRVRECARSLGAFLEIFLSPAPADGPGGPQDPPLSPG